LGETIDDAVGEAFDKTAKLIGLPYPGGPLVDRHAREGNPHRFTFPEPQISGLNFSFSGLKTAVLYFLQNGGKNQIYKEEYRVSEAERNAFITENLNDICASVQHRIITILLKKLKKAAVQTGIKNICIAGGVSANSGLRKAMQEMGSENNWNIFIPDFKYCTDNAAMIAITAYYKFLANDFVSLNTNANARSDW
jgi:N6-L-threonylcarbamoyladenine synthase